VSTPSSDSRRARPRRDPRSDPRRNPAHAGVHGSTRATSGPRVPASAAPVSALPIDVPSGPGSFAALGVPHLLCAVLAAQGLTEAFPIQTATVPDAMHGRDVLGQGRTGSGKTLAFALPVVARLAATPRRQGDRRPRALVLVPTRELASQVEAVIRPLAAIVGLRTATVFGGVAAGPQLSALRAGVEIIIGCPGRLADHLGTRALDLSGIEITVIDEADHMADVGFLPVVRRLLDATPRQGQRLLFSATLAGGVDQVVRQYLTNPTSHAVATEAPVEMTHHVLVVHADDRVNVVADLARAQRVVVFTRTKHRAKQLAQRLSSSGLSAVDLHGNLSQNARTRNLDLFSSGRASALVATDIAARGIHVDEVPLVVHADPPVEHKAYVHRSGRTARAGAAGVVVTLATVDQIADVKDLLRNAGITAAWSRLQAGGKDALDAIDGRGVAYVATAADRAAGAMSGAAAPAAGRRNTGRPARPPARTSSRSSRPARNDGASSSRRSSARRG